MNEYDQSVCEDICLWGRCTLDISDDDIERACGIANDDLGSFDWTIYDFCHYSGDDYWCDRICEQGYINPWIAQENIEAECEEKYIEYGRQAVPRTSPSD